MRNSLIFVKNAVCSVRYWQTDYIYLKLICSLKLQSLKQICPLYRNELLEFYVGFMSVWYMYSQSHTHKI